MGACFTRKKGFKFISRAVIDNYSSIHARFARKNVHLNFLYRTWSTSVSQKRNFRTLRVVCGFRGIFIRAGNANPDMALVGLWAHVIGIIQQFEVWCLIFQGPKWLGVWKCVASQGLPEKLSYARIQSLQRHTKVR